MVIIMNEQTGPNTFYWTGLRFKSEFYFVRSVFRYTGRVRGPFCRLVVVRIIISDLKFRSEIKWFSPWSEGQWSSFEFPSRSDMVSKVRIFQKLLFWAISTFSDRPTLTLGQHRMATICQKAEDMACCRIVSGLYLFVFK